MTNMAQRVRNRLRHRKKKYSRNTFGGGCDRLADDMGLPWTCRELWDCFSMPYGMSTTRLRHHGRVCPLATPRMP